MEEEKIIISVYVDFGVVYEYEVASVEKGREHASKIIQGGYRHTPIDSNDLEFIPPHKIEKVKVKNGGESFYKDKARTT